MEKYCTCKLFLVNRFILFELSVFLQKQTRKFAATMMKMYQMKMKKFHMKKQLMKSQKQLLVQHQLLINVYIFEAKIIQMPMKKIWNSLKNMMKVFIFNFLPFQKKPNVKYLFYILRVY